LVRVIYGEVSPQCNVVVGHDRLAGLAGARETAVSGAP
jgi:hypothetical protein